MDHTDRGRLLVVVLCVLPGLFSGCKSGRCCQWWPWANTSDTVAGITPPPERMRAIRAMAKEAARNGPQEQQRVASQLAEMYPREPDPLIRGEIVRALGAYPHAVSMQTLIEASRDADADVRVAACSGLGRQDGPEAAATLRKTLTDDTRGEVRIAAAKALGHNREPATIAALGAALEDRDPAMQYQAVVSLRTAAPEDLGNDVERWRYFVKGQTPPSAKPISVAERAQGKF